MPLKAREKTVDHNLNKSQGQSTNGCCYKCCAILLLLLTFLICLHIANFFIVQKLVPSRRRYATIVRKPDYYYPFLAQWLRAQSDIRDMQEDIDYLAKTIDQIYPRLINLQETIKLSPLQTQDNQNNEEQK